MYPEVDTVGTFGQYSDTSEQVSPRKGAYGSVDWQWSAQMQMYPNRRLDGNLDEPI